MTRTATVIVVLAFVTLILIGQHFAGTPALPDGRLASSPWRVIAVGPLANNVFVLAVEYPGQDVRVYRLAIDDPDQRDQFLRAEQAMKKGKAMIGRAKHSRAGLANDGAMDFEFGEAPESEPKHS